MKYITSDLIKSIDSGQSSDLNNLNNLNNLNSSSHSSHSSQINPKSINPNSLLLAPKPKIKFKDPLLIDNKNYDLEFNSSRDKNLRVNPNPNPNFSPNPNLNSDKRSHSNDREYLKPDLKEDFKQENKGINFRNKKVKTSNISDYIIVGDIHGDYKKLINLLKKLGIYKLKSDQWENTNNFKLIFLGDLNDPKLSCDILNKKEMSSFKCISIVKELTYYKIAVSLRSNHQSNLIFLYNCFLKNKLDKVNLKSGLNHTLEEVKNLYKYNPDKLYEYINWLNHLPYYYQIKDKEGKVYICSHAFYREGMRQYKPNIEDKKLAIFGPKSTKNKRLIWWKNQKYYSNKFIQVVGHYHNVGFFPNKQEPKIILLDGKCGSDNGQLVAYQVNKKTLIYI